MDVIINKKFSFREQPFYKLIGYTVGLVDRDLVSRSFYEQKLLEHNVQVVTMSDPGELVEQIFIQPLHAVVVSIETGAFDKYLAKLRKFNERFPLLPIITIGRNMQEMQLNAIMKTGSKLHINKDLSHPRDILIALEQVIH